MKRFFRCLALFYLLGLGLLLLALRWLGEGSIYTGPTLFLPAVVWILPGLGLALVATLFDLRMAVILWFVVLWFGWSYLGFQWHRPLAAEAGDLTVVSCNLGLDLPTSALVPFVLQENPDLIAIQEAYGRQGELRRQFPGYEVRTVDQFHLLSRFPIRKVRVVELQEAQRREPYAARFEIDVRGRKIAFYNVHLPTPRKLFSELRENPRLFLPTRLSEQEKDLRSRQRKIWAERAAQIQELAAVMKSERLPMIAGGDFNMPMRGTGYARFTSFLSDSFARRGRGFGWTFPCDRPPPWEQFMPWLRLDYQFASDEWRICEALIEPKRQAQHLATAARYRLETESISRP